MTDSLRRATAEAAARAGDPLSRAAAATADAADPLAGFRARFAIADPERIYLDGNSLGRLPLATRDRLAAIAAEWGERLVEGWTDWIDAPARAGDLLAEHVLGARPGEVVVTDSVTVNLYKLVCAVLDARPAAAGAVPAATGGDARPPAAAAPAASGGDAGRPALVTDRGNFPTDRHVLEGIAARRGLELRLFDGAPDAATLPCGRGDIVVLAHVDYRTAQLADLPALQAAVTERGATLIWDLSHSAGAVPIGLHAAGAELAVGCTYKYLNAGPGAPGYLYVAAELQPRLRSPIWGWFAQRDQFAMERDHDPDPSVRRFLAGTPSILGLAAVEEGARLTGEAGIARLAAKAAAQTELLIALHDAWLAPLGFTLASPCDPARRGSHVALRHPDGRGIAAAMIERAGVVPDFRDPDVIRLAVAPLYTRFVDVWDGLDRLRRLAA